LFELSYQILLYDLTSTYFEGQCANNPQARRGYSRDSRGDCPQVVIALIVTTDGYPLGYEVFAGNTQDSTTVQQVVKKVEQEHGKADRIWVMDRGNVSEANLSFLRDRGARYIVGTPKAMLRKVQGEITDEGWRQVREGIDVKLIQLPATGARETSSATQEEAADTLVLCRSQDRVAKESAMLERFAGRMEEGLRKLAKSADSGRLKDLDVANQRLGRLQEKNWRATGCFQVSITPVTNDAAGKAKLQVTWTRDQQARQSLCGCYLLRTNLRDADPVELWRQYIQLA
jgi:transposase